MPLQHLLSGDVQGYQIEEANVRTISLNIYVSGFPSHSSQAVCSIKSLKLYLYKDIHKEKQIPTRYTLNANVDVTPSCFYKYYNMSSLNTFPILPTAAFRLL